MNELPVHFFHSRPETVPATIRSFGVDQSSSAEDNWITQTYLHLKALGHPVTLSGSLPREGIVVLCYTMKRRFKRLYETATHGGLLVVAARADDVPVLYADAEVLQNGRYADGRRGFFVPHWPQPGLIPRDISRGATLRTIGFKGGAHFIHPMFSSTRWQAFLRENDLVWDPDLYTAGEQDHRLDHLRWHDYLSLDLILAVRPFLRRRYLTKPASKLVNAWHAGVPALLGPEYAFQELRRSDLDYIEVRSLDDAIRAVSRLRSDPGLYRAMVENGLERAREYSVERITGLWAELLFEQLPQLERTRGRRIARNRSLAVRGTFHFLRRPSLGGNSVRTVAGKLFRTMKARARNAFRAGRWQLRGG